MKNVIRTIVVIGLISIGATAALAGSVFAPPAERPIIELRFSGIDQLVPAIDALQEIGYQRFVVEPNVSVGNQIQVRVTTDEIPPAPQPVFTVGEGWVDRINYLKEYVKGVDLKLQPNKRTLTSTPDPKPDVHE